MSATRDRAVFQPHPAKAGYYIVCLGGGTYEVDSETGFCNCAGFQFRGKCKHGPALADHLEAERACAYCHGFGQVFLRVRYADDRPITCVHCSGTGLRDASAAAASLNDLELRKMFA